MASDEAAGGVAVRVEATVGREHACQATTPHAVLIAEIMDSRLPKSEREHAACREIERLHARLRDVRQEVGFVVSKWSQSEPEEGFDDGKDETWRSWFVAAFDLMGSELHDLLTPNAQTQPTRSRSEAKA
ncbi:MAG: hypothetical protein ACPGJF_10525 [Sinimarinibacterium flocculans]|uniref:hypothetical protein n=1 Tax=Sinimarinibacterium flocculans TaxID=985250 RepID=UPI003C365CCF